MGLIHGLDLNNVQRPVVVDDNGKLSVSVIGIGSVYTSNYLDTIENTNLVTNLNYLYGETVPVGQNLNIKLISLRYTGTITSVTLYFGIEHNGIRSPFMRENPVVSARYYTYLTDLYLQEGDKPYMQVSAATAGDDAIVHFNGFHFVIT